MISSVTQAGTQALLQSATAVAAPPDSRASALPSSARCAVPSCSRFRSALLAVSFSPQLPARAAEWRERKGLSGGMEMNVTVLTTGFWPTYKVQRRSRLPPFAAWAAAAYALQGSLATPAAFAGRAAGCCCCCSRVARRQAQTF